MFNIVVFFYYNFEFNSVSWLIFNVFIVVFHGFVCVFFGF